MSRAQIAPKKWRFAGKTYHRVTVTLLDNDTVVTWRRWRVKDRQWMYGADTLDVILHQICVENFYNEQ